MSALKSEVIAELAKFDTMTDEQTIARIRQFLASSGMLQYEFAQEIGYANQTIKHYMRGAYDGATHYHSNIAIRVAAKRYIDAHEFRLAYTRNDRHHDTTAYREVRQSALNALEHGSAYLVDGPPGTEKTHTLRRIEQEINSSGAGHAVYLYARVGHTPREFLVACCHEAGIPANGTIDGLIRKLRYFLGRERVLLMVDEAQHLDRRGLEVLRQLLDMPPFFGVMLAGSHDLTQRLSHWEMEQWRSRLRKTHFLNGPSRAEASEILRAELGPLTDGQCAAFLDRCMATGERIEQGSHKGKPAPVKFRYISARDLFNAIETIHQANQNQQKEGAA